MTGAPTTRCIASLLAAVVAMLLAAGALSCGESRPAPPGVETGALSTIETGAVPSASPPVAPRPVVIDWSAARADRQIAPALLPARSGEVLERVGLPALLPREPELLERAIVTGSPVWYGASIPLEGATLYLHGSRLAHPAPEDVESPGDGEVNLSRGTGIVTVAFQAFGAAYSAHLECSRPFDDPRCVEDRFLLGVVEDLGVAGGRP